MVPIFGLKNPGNGEFENTGVLPTIVALSNSLLNNSQLVSAIRAQLWQADKLQVIRCDCILSRLHVCVGLVDLPRCLGVVQGIKPLIRA